MRERHVYDDAFFDYINQGSARSARRVAPLLQTLARPRSVLDVGCGVGAWLEAWGALGLDDWIGVDGDYVDDEKLLIPAHRFQRRDLSAPFRLARTFELVCSFEVAEHIEPAFAETFVDNIVAHGDVVAFSAATPGQGGEFHVNEQPYDYWRRKFLARGYACFDAVRPLIAEDRQIEPWYRYNTFLFANAEGAARLEASVRDTLIDALAPTPDRSPLAWRLRRAVLKRLPRRMIDALADASHRLSLAARR